MLSVKDARPIEAATQLFMGNHVPVQALSPTTILMIESLPVELIAKIIGEVNLADVVKTSQVSRRLRLVASDTILNVWRLPILRTLHSTTEYEDALKNLSVYMSVPRHNWVDILALARASYILFEATLPNLKEAEWEEAFKRRFLLSWTRWRKDSPWKATFLRFITSPAEH